MLVALYVYGWIKASDLLPDVDPVEEFGLPAPPYRDVLVESLVDHALHMMPLYEVHAIVRTKLREEYSSKSFSSIESEYNELFGRY